MFEKKQIEYKYGIFFKYETKNCEEQKKLNYAFKFNILLNLFLLISTMCSFRIGNLCQMVAEIKYLLILI